MSKLPSDKFLLWKNVFGPFRQFPDIELFKPTLRQAK